MKAVLISIQPKWCELIASGKKTVEIRKTKPKLDVPFKVYIYCTKGRGECLWRWNGGLWYDKQFPDERPNRTDGKVIGEFVCDNLEMLFDTNGNCANYMTEILPDILKRTALTYNEFQAYVNGRASKNSIYGWHISNLKTYDKPKELCEFFVYCERCDKIPIGCKFAYEEISENGYYSECLCDFKRPIERPPQSWCYVESEE